MTEKKDTERWVYIGPTLVAGGKVGQQWVNESAPNSETHVFTKLVKAPYIGSIYEIEIVARNDDGSVKTARCSNKHVGLFRDGDLLSQWEIASNAFDTLRALERQEKVLGKESIKEALEPFIKAMHKTNYEGRRAIKVLVVEYLERYGG